MDDPRRLMSRNFRGLNEAVVGKTIAAAILDDQTIGLRFTDGTYVLGYNYGDECEVRWAPPPDPLDLSALGVITEEECRAAVTKAEAEAKARGREEQRRQYEAMKREFEGEAT